MAAQVGRLEGLECEVDQLQNVLQSVASELESGHQHAQVSSLCTKQQAHQYSFFYVSLLHVSYNGGDKAKQLHKLQEFVNCHLVLAWVQQHAFTEQCHAVQHSTAKTFQKTILLSPAYC